MRVPGWMTAALLLLAACDKTETPPAEPPAVEAEAPLGPPAALRRDLRTCEGDARGILGEIEYGVRVDASGRVTRVEVLQGSVPASVLNCSLQRLRAWEFPASREGAAFRFTMRFGEDAPGGSESKAIKAAIKQRTSVLQDCYMQALHETPSAGGKVRFDVSVAASGHVESVTIQPEPDASIPETMDACMQARMGAWRFPTDAVPRGARVSFWVVFSGSSAPSEAADDEPLGPSP